mmetsp:Transcript_5236/g.5932  ORF Transcript_5236/g.5932 Transcript_5236/m.5932 type:complete len:544 (-) Transcript_5236:267-1898(-)
MSQSLVVFEPSGKINYLYNNKISGFNEHIASIVNETYNELETNFFTTSSNQKRFYSYKRDGRYASLYFDIVTTLDSEKIKQTLIGILKTYTKVTEEYDEEDEETEAKVKKLIDYQFNQLMKYKQSEKPVARGIETPLSAVSSSNSGTSTPNKQKTGASTKKMRKWDGDEMVESNGNSEVLDFSNKNESNTSNTRIDNDQLKVDPTAFSKDNDLVLVQELNDILGDDDEEEESTNTKSGGFFGKVTSYFGSSINIDEVSKKFYDQLITKNIAPPTAKAILEKIKNKLGNKQGVTIAMYKQTMVEELTKILTPNVSTDLLYEIKDRSESKKPYVISVVGVNGVGKSTNLAKLAYWFLQNNLNVLICACDTFRSGAVEQLKVHVNNLQKLNNSSSSESKIDIFEKGYGGGDHVVATAKLAIQHASNENYDIVLIDTAGRTHSNAKLMTPLKKFGDAANPDKIIMVGEALVGTDSVEQAINFNNAFGNRRNLDFFIISKVDTVGDLVGTMINMVMATKVPILFVGTGQTYTDIKRLSVKTVVDMLMN